MEQETTLYETEDEFYDELLSLSLHQTFEELDSNIVCLHKAIEGSQVALVDELLTENIDVEIKNKEGETPLMVAVGRGNEVLVKKLIMKGADVNCEDKNKFTPLQAAIWNKFKTIAELLLENGAKVNIRDDLSGETCLHFAVRVSNCSIVKMLLEHNSDINATDLHGETALHYAIRSRGPWSAEMVRLLLNAGADMHIPNDFGSSSLDLINELLTVKVTSYMYFARKMELAEMRINVLENDGEFLKPFQTLCTFEAECHKELDQIKAMKYGDISLYNILSDFSGPLFASDSVMEKYVKSDTLKNVFPLYAVLLERNFVEGVKRKKLLKDVTETQEAIVDELLTESIDMESKNKEGETPLMVAVGHGNVIMVEKLIKKGANVNCEDKNKFTPLQAAIWDKFETIVELLLKNGAKVNIRDYYNDETRLHFAVRVSNCSIVKMLLEHKSDVNAIDLRGETALHYAVTSLKPWNAEMVRLLLNAGADINIMDNSGIRSIDLIKSRSIDLIKCRSIDVRSYMLCARKMDLAKVRINLLQNDREFNKMTLCAFDAKCHKELDQIKALKFGDISLYNILSDFNNPLFASNTDMEKCIKSDTLKKDFPIYAVLLERKFKEGMKRNILLDDLRLSVKIIKGSNVTQIVLPNEMSRKILVYLDDCDLLSVTKAFKC